jgi:ribonuclease E
VQVVKDADNAIAALLTTRLSLAGRYLLLMPNTSIVNISHEIANAADRIRLKDLIKQLEIPDGMGVILRDAGTSRTKAEIERDFEYLLRTWEEVRDFTLKSTAPTLVYEAERSA